jgi:hypothetical protein
MSKQYAEALQAFSIYSGREVNHESNK